MIWPNLGGLLSVLEFGFKLSDPRSSIEDCGYSIGTTRRFRESSGCSQCWTQFCQFVSQYRASLLCLPMKSYFLHPCQNYYRLNLLNKLGYTNKNQTDCYYQISVIDPFSRYFLFADHFLRFRQNLGPNQQNQSGLKA